MAVWVFSPVTTTPSTNFSTECSLQADFQYGFFTVTYSLMFILGLPGNALALYFLSHRSQRTKSAHIYFMNLAVVDTAFICLLPFRIYYHNIGNDWVFGDVACRITGTLYYANIYLSIGFFTCICLERYLAVVHPLTYLRLKSSRYPLVLTIGIWMTGIAIVLPLILGGPLVNVPENSSSTSCFEDFSSTSWQHRLLPYNVCALIFGFVVPFTIIGVVFPVMARRVCQIRTSTHRKVALRIISLILAISLLCFLPYHITHFFYFLMRMGIIQHCTAFSHIYKLRRITLALVSFNSCLNPVLYFIPSISRGFNFSLPSHTKQVYTLCDAKLCREKGLSVTSPLSSLQCQQEMGMVTLRAQAEWRIEESSLKSLQS
ncbi:lysophosphatidic acid receptor 6-like [Ascaphus truei]|uniref:lysophosphatidic acid receptor 6-like n=1 Tax=Ascaphus truei TaxID=8439 RepID=UPI003F590E52